MDNSVMMAVAMALVYWLSRGMIGGYFALFFIGNPIFIGIISGLIYGDVKSGLMIGGIPAYPWSRRLPLLFR